MLLLALDVIEIKVKYIVDIWLRTSTFDASGTNETPGQKTKIMKANLTLHCGAAKVERQQVLDVATPANTETWYPLAHGDFITGVEKALEASNMRVVEQAHSLTKGGDRYFGLFQVSNCQSTGDDYSYILGLRNSHDKSFPAGLVVGSQVFVCDNLAFSGEIKIARKHTRFISQDLPKLTSNAVGMLSEKWTLMTDRINLYKTSEISDRDAHDFIVRSLDVGATTLQQVPAIINEWRTPRHPEFAQAKTAWRLFNAFTEVSKETSLTLLPQRTIRLHGLLDSQVGFVYKGAKEIIAGTVDAEAVVANN